MDPLSTGKRSSLLDRDEAVIWHPFTPQKDRPPVLPILGAKKSLLFDDHARAYIDAISSWWVTIHGHAHPHIAESIYRQALQLEQVIFAGFTHEPAVTLAERLLPLLPGPFERIFYSDNGSTSTEVGIKMAIQFHWNRGLSLKKLHVNGTHAESAGSNRTFEAPRRTKILALRNGYHGDTFGAMSVSDRSVFTLAFQDRLFEVCFIDPPSKNFALPLDFSLEEFACFIYEPLVQGAGGMNMYDAGGLESLLRLCRNAGVICIADEVMTGFGRTGKLFASEYLFTKPDIICLSKGLTGGTLPLGVTACTAEIYSAFLNDDKRTTFFHGHSFTANPLSCTAAIASLELFDWENSMKKVEWISERHQQFLEELNAEGLAVLNPRQLGTILAFELDQGTHGYLNVAGSIFQEACMRLGVYLRPLGNTVYIMPPYCIEENELLQVYGAIRQTLQTRLQ